MGSTAISTPCASSSANSSPNIASGRGPFHRGESYGGFRVAKLARKLQESYGVGLNGAILISQPLS